MSSATVPVGDPNDESAPDLHTTAGKLADLYRRNDEAVHAGSARAVERQHARGKKTAYEIWSSDWSSDVCSSDLVARRRVARLTGHEQRDRARR